MHIPFWDVRIPRGSILLFFGTKKRTQNTTHTGEPSQPMRKSRNNVHMRPILPRDK